jgi:hypothetical protein
MSGDDLVRLRPSQPTPEKPASEPDSDFDLYLLEKRRMLAEELRIVENICVKRNLITRLLCAPGRVR